LYSAATNFTISFFAVAGAAQVGGDLVALEGTQAHTRINHSPS
jgi:hypothetical protein